MLCRILRLCTPGHFIIAKINHLNESGLTEGNKADKCTTLKERGCCLGPQNTCMHIKNARQNDLHKQSQSFQKVITLKPGHLLDHSCRQQRPPHLHRRKALTHRGLPSIILQKEKLLRNSSSNANQSLGHTSIYWNKPDPQNIPARKIRCQRPSARHHKCQRLFRRQEESRCF